MWQSLLEHNSTVYSLNTRSQHYFLKTRHCTQRFVFYIFDSFLHVKSPLVGSTMLTGTPCINTYICIHRCIKYLLLFSHLRISSRYERRGGPSKCHAETFLLIHAKWTVLRSFAFLSQFFFFFLLALSWYQRYKAETSYSYCSVHTVKSSLFKLIGRRNLVWITKFSDMKYHLFECRLRLIMLRRICTYPLFIKELVNKQQFHKVVFEIDWYTNTFYTQCM